METNTVLNNISSLTILAGLSGAGKSTAIRALSDLGFYVIDNLPVALFRQFLEYASAIPEKHVKTAILPDIDSEAERDDLLNLIDLYRRNNPNRVEVMFLDCSTDVIVKRYSETRRPHPGFEPHIDKTLEDAIQREREFFAAFKMVANYRIDTSQMTVHDLKREIKGYVESILRLPGKPVRLNFLSFGFKYGIPLDCDLVVDVRFLPNPYFVDELRYHSGLDQEVMHYVLQSELAKQFLTQYASLLNFLLPQYVFEGKSYLNVGIGCTGGKHRSVVIAEELSKRVATQDYLVSVKHRDVDKKGGLA